MEQNEAEDLIEIAEQGEDVEWKEIHNTTCDHYWVESESQDPNSDMVSIQCKNCWAGCSIQPKEVKIEDGKMIKI